MKKNGYVLKDKNTEEVKMEIIPTNIIYISNTKKNI